MMNVALKLCVSLGLVHIYLGAGQSPINKCQIEEEDYEMPQGCTWFVDEKHLYCSNIPQLPNGYPKGTKRITFSGGSLDTITYGAFYGCLDVTWITFVSTEVSAIQNGAFKSLENLQRLNLESNKLQFKKTHVEEGVFDDLSNLQILLLSFNEYGDLTSYRDDLFTGLYNLQELSLDGIPDGVPFGSGFATLTHLKKLCISGRLNKLEKDTFDVFQNSTIHYLKILLSDLETIIPLSLASLPALESLEFIQNAKLSLAELGNAWYGLIHSNITKIIIYQPTGYRDTCDSLNETFFNYLRYTKLTEFSVTTPCIIYVCKNMSKYLPNLQVLKISNIVVHVIKIVMSNLYNFRSLWKIDMGFSQQVIPEKQSPHLHSGIQYYNLHASNKQLQSCDVIKVPPSLNFININLHPSIEVLFPLCMKGQNNLTHISLTYSRLSHINEFYIEEPFSGPLEIILDYNYIKEFDSVFLNRSIENGLNLHTLSLSYNFLDLMNKSPFKHLYRLKNLTLESNKIFKLHDSVFKGLKNITCLSVSQNNIKFVDQFTFSKLTTLRYLNLSYNSMKNISFSLVNLTNLKNLHLENNMITYLNQDTIRELNTLRTKTNVTVFLHGNPLVCSCDTITFIAWLLNSQFVPLDEYSLFPALSCSYEENFIEIREFKKSDLWERYIKRCASHGYLVLSFILSGFMVLCLGLTICVYRHRWDLRFLCLRIVRKRKIFHDEYDSKHYEFDAFVAFDQEDYDWVSNELIPNLEEPEELHNKKSPHFRLCVNNRDWLYGTRIVENIIESVLNSRKTILVLTPSFVQSNWCMYELEMARMRCFEEGRDIIIVVMLQKVPASAMNNTLRTLIKRVTYLEWPGENVQKALFWEKLRRSLLKLSNKAPVCECGRKVYEV